MAKEALTIRKATGDDLDAVDRLESESFSVDRFARRNLARLLKSRSAALFVAERDGAAVGYVAVLFRRGARAARIYSLATAPAARGRGVGAALVGRALDYAKKQGSQRAVLEVRASNRDALALYRAFGFRERGKMEGYYDDGGAALRLECLLEPSRCAAS